MAGGALTGQDKLTFIISPPLEAFGCWLEQLLAESLGKDGKGVMPIDGESVGCPGAYGSDRIFVYMRLDGDSTHDMNVSELERAGFPVVTLRMHGPYDIGREIFRWEFATAVAGEILGVNPFDQPNVHHKIKDITMDAEGFQLEARSLPRVISWRWTIMILQNRFRAFCRR